VTVRFDDDATPFQAALARVAVTDDTRAGLEFGGAKAITALAASDDPKDVWASSSASGPAASPRTQGPVGGGRH
jgi:hypothetical protein